ncbi:serine protease [Nonlabens spongiae]|uniref:Serine protease n=1 Tax=Nonlabens spongiae TaxID=331648 RepID=A0A1W6MNY8_9FLAO|nr:S8 family serine peptidase [Nonlabens spongiae]ARN79324.1 serine protease [Nonlabens spongiae]
MRICIVLFWLLFAQLSFGQQLHAWVYFADKPNVSTSLANPSTILTQRALVRKARHNIVIDQRDVPLNQSYVNQVKNSIGITYKAQSKWFNCVHVIGSQLDVEALESLAFVDRVEFADPLLNPRVEGSWDKYAELNTQNQNYGSARNQIEMIDLDQLHNAGFKGDNVFIAVTDSGFPGIPNNAGFSHLINNGRILGGRDFVERDNSYYGDNIHGTRVLSVMAGLESFQFQGTAPDASYYLFRTEESAQETPAELAYWVAAAERADSLGVDVINVSLGYLGFDNPAENLTYQDMDGMTSFISRGANVAFEKGMVVVTSAGNSGRSTVHPYIAAPADALGSLCIGSVDASMQRSVFSSVGPTFDGRIAPDIVAQGTATALIDENGSVTTGNGTSFSAPLISGAIACLMQAFPDLTPLQIYDLVRQSASQAATPDNQIGYGVPDFGQILTTLSNENELIDNMSIYVRDGIINLSSSNEDQEFQIFALSGQLVHSGCSVKNQIDATVLKSGIYLLRLRSEGTIIKIAISI